MLRIYAHQILLQLNYILPKIQCMRPSSYRMRYLRSGDVGQLNVREKCLNVPVKGSIIGDSKDN